MKKNKIVVILIIAVIALGICMFAIDTPVVNAHENEITIEKPIEEKNVPKREFFISYLNVYTDSNLNNYSLEDLTHKINEKKSLQKKAHDLAECARYFGWPESSPAIQSAKAEWANAQLALNLYQTRYNEKYEELKIDSWNTKSAEYPAATQIWRYMKDLGWNDYVCAGIMGNLMAEVGGQSLDIQYWLYGKGYYGMCQWSKTYKEVWGADLLGQCNFLRDTIKYEIDTFGYAYQKGFNFNSFLALKNEKEAAKAFAKCYERCGSASYSVRQKNATVAYNYFTK